MSTPSLSSDKSSWGFCLRQYSYKPLDIKRNEIRLIKLQDTIKSQPLRGNIIHVPLTAQLPYWALSYCWGTLKDKRTIIVDGKKLRITVNLDEALRQLGNSRGMLWVDAICINQEDIPERSRQVLRMGDIYSLASGVAVWLGAASKTSDKAMDFLQVLATKNPRSQYDEYMKELPLEWDPGMFGVEWTALKDLLKNGYWSRTWIIQELALCQSSIIVHCGTKSLPWESFETVLYPWNEDGFITTKIRTCIEYVVHDVQEISEVVAGLDNLLMLARYQRTPQLRFANVCYLLTSTNGFLATDPRDRIYGMLGMNDELRELVPHPNYEDSVGVVFRDLTKALLASGCKLDFICLKSPTHVNQSDAVSWVPNWDVFGLWMQSPDWPINPIQQKHSGRAYCADGGKHATLSYVRDASTLRVRGIFFDRVDGLGSTNKHRVRFLGPQGPVGKGTSLLSRLIGKTHTDQMRIPSGP